MDPVQTESNSAKTHAAPPANPGVDVQIVPGEGANGGTPLGASPPATGANGSGTAATPGTASAGNGKTVMLPTATLGRIKKEARESGAQKARQELEAKAKELGYSSLDDMMLAAARAKAGASRNGTGVTNRGNERGAQAKDESEDTADEDTDETDGIEASDGADTPPAKPQPPKGADKKDRRAQAQYERDMQQYQKQAAQFQKRMREESSRARRANRELEALRAEMAVRESAVRAGVKDVDYAVRLLTRHLDGKSDEDLNSFNEEKFFTDLRDEKPYLFGEVTRGATTGTAGGGQPPPVKAKDAAKQIAENGKVDARKMKPEEWRKYLSDRGLRSPSV